MGQIYPPAPVLGLVAVSSRHDSAFAWARQRFSQLWSGLGAQSPEFSFHHTEYYRSTMGPDLRKQFLVSPHPLEPGMLSGLKVTTNAWEEEFARLAALPDARPLNLDPGYLALDKLVLASTKNHAHRLYLDQGIYAEITLQYRAKRWQTCPWTYPDYAEPEFHRFFSLARERLPRGTRSTDSE